MVLWCNIAPVQRGVKQDHENCRHKNIKRTGKATGHANSENRLLVGFLLLFLHKRFDVIFAFAAFAAGVGGLFDLFEGACALFHGSQDISLGDFFAGAEYFVWIHAKTSLSDLPGHRVFEKDRLPCVLPGSLSKACLRACTAAIGPRRFHTILKH